MTGRWAERNRTWLAEQEILAIALMCAPGAGRTTLLDRTIRELAGEVRVSVVEVGRRSVFGAERIRATGARVIDVGVRPGHHMDAAAFATALRRLDPPRRSLVFVDHVGGRVELGEHRRVVITAVTEGADKPARSPRFFRGADVVLLNKIDLLPAVDFDLAGFAEAVARVAGRAEILRVSATRGDGLAGWYGWLRTRHGRSVLST